MAGTQSLQTDPEEAKPVEQRFEEGFTIKTVIGALFIALFMLPGGMYLGLVAGWGVGDAAEWVTIVLFAEVARRSFMPLRKQEIYILFYVAASLTTVINAGRGLGGGPFANMVWNAYFISSEPARPIADQIPQWAIPSATSPAVVQRDLFHPDWWRPNTWQPWVVGFWKPGLLLVLTEICGRLSWMSMGYALFRVTSDVERLPFPFAPVAAQGATALAEAGTESWRWSIFSAGAVVGMLFGLVYVAVPIITGLIFGTPVQILPIPFADYTVNMESLLPAAIVGISFSLGNVLIGFVLPYEIVLGAAVASVLGMIVINPILYHAGLLPNYRFGSDAITTKLSVDMDFWLSIGIGVNIAIAIIGFWMVGKALADARRLRRETKYSLAPPLGRGDVPVVWAIAVWLACTLLLIGLCRVLVPGFPTWMLFAFGLLWSPLNSYISARMHGLTGRGVGFPYLREGSVVATGYQKIDIWYAPLPLMDHGWAAQRFREVELTQTRFTSVLKAEALMLPVLLVASFMFWSFFWRSTPVPSVQLPFAQKFWPVDATMSAVIQQINVPRTDGEANWFLRAIKFDYIGYGILGGLATYGLFAVFKLPLLFFYGFAGGLGLFPANTLPQLLGAWFGRRYMVKRYGAETWRAYAPVLLAGFSCGTGLVGMASIALALIAKVVAKLPY